MPAATAAAPPPVEPPGVMRGFHGLRVRPCSAFAVKKRALNGGTLVRPMPIAPALRQLAIAGLSALATLSLNATMPLVVGRPA